MMMIGVMSRESIGQAISRRLSLEVLPLNFTEEDAMFVSLDRIDSRTPEKIRDQKVLFSDGQNMLLALGPDIANDSVQFHDKHGHFLFLYPDPSLLKPVTPPAPGHLSEDFFANSPTEPGRDANPNYHTFSDKVIDIAYSVDITSAATFALKELASK